MSRQIQDEIRDEIAQNKILIYMKGTSDAPRCGFSARAIGVLGWGGFRESLSGFGFRNPDRPASQPGIDSIPSFPG